MQLSYKRLFGSLLILFAGLPAGAQQYLEYRAGMNLPYCIWYGAKPVAGVNTNVDSVILPFTPQAGDSDPQHYQLQAGSIVYAPPTAAVTPDDPTMSAINVYLNKRANDLTKDQYSELMRVAAIQDKTKRDTAYAALQPGLPK